jgi:hypothetical protein
VRDGRAKGGECEVPGGVKGFTEVEEGKKRLIKGKGKDKKAPITVV